MQEYAHEFADIRYALPTPLQTTGGCWIVRAGQNIAKPEYNVGPKVIGQYGFHMVLEGTVQVADGNEPVKLSKGDIFCLFPGRAYTYKTLSGSRPPLEMSWFALSGGQTELLLGELGLTPEAYFMRQALNQPAIRTIKRLLLLFQKETADPLLEQSLLYELIWRLKPKSAAVKQSSEPKRNWVAKVKEYLELHYTEQIRIEEAADYAGVHRSHLYVSFSKQYGCSPMQYLQRLRMDKGAQMLKQTPLTVTEIALSLGYPDLYSFTRAFSKYFGLSPTAYRD
ncbi:AraC family transcriptional regulator [Paenibacillus thalictri]|uniref:AraC family transcriptional regulator n=1 Tax=Paenibacillus thalictri TaxID=2527873 RepID=A0A4Q9DRS9_9BACL|nr:AraC family transcriptional regulator [Paenibacillus thalictri]TBL79517.1 AraC family transcriptional regulator [Paenibacillus thalictri]